MNTSELTSSLRIAISGLHKGLRKKLSAAQTYSMTEMETIGLLARSTSLLPTELAAITRVKTQTMSQILKKLEEQGVIKRSPSKKDKRKVFISLTAIGMKMVEKSRYERDEWLSEKIEKNLNAKEKELLIKALPVLNKLMSNG